MRISDWSSDVCSSDLAVSRDRALSISSALSDDFCANAVARASMPSARSHDPWPTGPNTRSPACRAILPIVVKRSEEHTSELQSLMRLTYAVFCLKKKKKKYQY